MARDRESPSPSLCCRCTPYVGEEIVISGSLAGGGGHDQCREGEEIMIVIMQAGR